MDYLYPQECFTQQDPYMLPKLIREYGIVIFPLLLLTSIVAYESIYMLLLELWCIAYGLLYY